MSNRRITGWLMLYVADERGTVFAVTKPTREEIDQEVGYLRNSHVLDVIPLDYVAPADWIPNDPELPARHAQEFLAAMKKFEERNAKAAALGLKPYEYDALFTA